MKLLLVYCHPDPASFGAVVRQHAAQALKAAGHELREIDLYAEGFQPVLSYDERQSYHTQTERNVAAVAPHVDALRWADGWLVVYPTWMYGAPAMLKGWLDRVWLPGVTFSMPAGNRRLIRGELGNIRLFIGITTSGSPWWWLKLIGDPGRSLFMKGMRPLYARRCRMRWMQLYNMDHASQADRSDFLARIDRDLPRFTALTTDK